jgi:hypothetical protein
MRTSKSITNVATVVAVPGLLAGLEALRAATRQPFTGYLVLPPLAVIIYLIFRDPNGEAATARSVILLPTLGAATGGIAYHFLGLTPAGLAVGTSIVLLLQAATNAFMPPALALCILAMLLHADPLTYVSGVLESTVLIFAVFTAWRLGSRGRVRLP